MIREIEKPKIDFKFNIFWDNFKYYYNEETREYFLETDWKSKYYFNLEGNIHRLDGPALINYYKYYYINYKYYYEKEFAKETNHLVCRICENFCKQGCFI